MWSQLLLLSTLASAKPDSALTSFLDRCQHMSWDHKCTSYKCMLATGLDLAVLSQIPCRSSSDCHYKLTGMECVLHPLHSDPRQETEDVFVELPRVLGRCECPHYFAFNLTECRCRRAERCAFDGHDCHNGMSCFVDHNEENNGNEIKDEDESNFCECEDLKSALFEPQSSLCVRSRFETSDDSEMSDETGEPDVPMLMVLTVLIVGVLLGLMAILAFFCTDCKIEKSKSKEGSDVFVVSKEQMSNFVNDNDQEFEMDVAKEEVIVCHDNLAFDKPATLSTQSIHV